MYDELTHEMARREQAGRLAGAARRRALRPAATAEHGPAEWVAARPRVGGAAWGSSDQGLRLAFAHGDELETVDGRRAPAESDGRRPRTLAVIDGVDCVGSEERVRRQRIDDGIRVAASDRALLLLFLLGQVDREVTGTPVEGDESGHVHRFFHADEPPGCHGQGDEAALITIAR